MFKQILLLAAMGISFGSLANSDCYIQANSGGSCESTTGGVVDIGSNSDVGECIGIGGKAPRYSFFSNCVSDITCVFYIDDGCNGHYYRQTNIGYGCNGIPNLIDNGNTDRPRSMYCSSNQAP